MQPMPPCSSPACWWPVQVSISPLGISIGHVICGFYLFIYFSSQLFCPLRFQNCPQTNRWEGFLVFGNFSSFRLPPQDGSLSLTLLFLFLSSIFCPTSFRRQWVAFLGVLCQHSEVVFLEFAQHSNVLSVNLWGRKWSPCPIPPPS